MALNKLAVIRAALSEYIGRSTFDEYQENDMAAAICAALREIASQKRKQGAMGQTAAAIIDAQAMQLEQP